MLRRSVEALRLALSLNNLLHTLLSLAGKIAMNHHATLCSSLVMVMSLSTAMAQTPDSMKRPEPSPDSYEGHLSAAKQAAGFEFTGTLARLCLVPSASFHDGVTAENRSAWYAEPVKVFDNLYWLGTKIHSSWALTDPKGIIIIDTLFNYAAEPEIVGGLKKMHLDPKNIKYVILSHGHSDHDEGVRLLQDRYGVHVIAGGPDWDSMENGPEMPGGKPKRDIVARDGQQVTVGANTVTIITTPGHTPGTLSMLFTVRDHGKPMVVAYSGGTSNIPLVHIPDGLSQFIDSQQKMGKAAADAGASIIMSNHSEFDGAYTKVRLLASRKPGEMHPYDVGTNGVQRYFKMTAECAEATRLQALGKASLSQ
jgi:metallo-beta-lactamase class B